MSGLRSGTSVALVVTMLLLLSTSVMAAAKKAKTTSIATTSSVTMAQVNAANAKKTTVEQMANTAMTERMAAQQAVTDAKNSDAIAQSELAGAQAAEKKLSAAKAALMAAVVKAKKAADDKWKADNTAMKNLGKATAATAKAQKTYDTAVANQAKATGTKKAAADKAAASALASLNTARTKENSASAANDKAKNELDVAMNAKAGADLDVANKAKEEAAAKLYTQQALDKVAKSGFQLSTAENNLTAKQTAETNANTLAKKAADEYDQVYSSYTTASATSITSGGTVSTTTTSTTVKFNDDKYPGVGPNECTPPSNITCTQNCTKTSGKGGHYVLPNNGRCAGVLAGAGYKCVGNSIALAQCCNFCTNSTSCSFFLHYIPAAPVCSGCGVCFTYSPGVAPQCATATVNGRLNANASTVGKPCPYTKHDPHFRGAFGTRFEFNGAPEKTYCLITDSDLHVNMKMRGYYDTRTIGASLLRNGLAVRTWIRELGYVWKGADGVQHSFRLASRNGKSDKRDNGFLALIEFDGRVLPSLEPGESYQLDGGLEFTFKGYETEGGGYFDVDAYTIRIGTQLVMDVKLRPAHPLLQTPDDSQVHLNVNFRHVGRTPAIHGIMGQTYRDGRKERAIDYSMLSRLLHTPFSADGDNGKGFLDGKASDYETTSVLATDCGYSAFTASQ